MAEGSQLEAAAPLEAAVPLGAAARLGVEDPLGAAAPLHSSGEDSFLMDRGLHWDASEISPLAR
jgi:hypothetical protein